MVRTMTHNAWARPRVRIGRLTFWLWSGSWSWVESLPCYGHCRNLYIGPFGVEWTRGKTEDAP